MRLEYVVRRFTQAVITILGVLSFSFFVIRFMPGGPEDYLYTKLMGTRTTDRQIRSLMEQYVNLTPDEPLHIQYVDYMVSLLTGDLGISVWYQEPVIEIIADGLPWTVFVSVVSLLLIYVTGITIGAVMAYKEQSAFDISLSSLSLITNSIPFYLLAILLLWVFALQTNWFPRSGRVGNVAPGPTLEFFGSAIHHATLPIISLFLASVGGTALAMRSNSIHVLGADYLRVARLRGLSEQLISTRYVARNAVLPLYTSMIISIGHMFGGSVILEEIFNYIGLGYYLFQAVNARDYMLMMGTFIFITIGVIVGMLVADMTYGLIDPRASTQSSRERYETDLLASVVATVRAVPDRIKRTLSSDEEEQIYANGHGVVEPGLDSKFNIVSETHITRRVRLYRLLDSWLLTPGRILWKDWRARIGVTVVAVYLFAGLVGVHLVDQPSALSGAGRFLQPFESGHYLGTDNMGRDIFAQLVHSTPPMLKMMASGAVFATGLAVAWGIFSGYIGGVFDEVMMSIADGLMSVPGLPLVIVIATVFEPRDPYTIGIILTINAWAGFSRQLRSQVITLRSESYIEASRAMNLPTYRILLLDVLPNLMPLALINFVGIARKVVFSAVGLYFLGILPFEASNWGIMLNSAYRSGTWYQLDTIHWLLAPTMAVVIISFGLLLLSQSADNIFNPKVRARHGPESSSKSPTAEE